MAGYNVTNLYQETYSIPYEWKKFLPTDIYNYHNLMYREFNSPVSLQMGVLLPFISALAGPKVKGLWSTRENVINFFTINIAASGVGKSACRKNLVTDPIQYITKNAGPDCNFPDMEVNKFTRAGIEDKLISTKGYCMVVSDEANGFIKDLKNRENKNESDIALLNQLYDGEGDKQTLAQNRQRIIPSNATSISMSLQQEAFVNGILNLGYSAWVDSGFSERFMVSAIKPYRHLPRESHQAREELLSKYDENLMGKIALGIFQHHYNNPTTYVLNDEAKDCYEDIVETYNEQFNLKWCSSQESKDVMDSEEKAEICCRSKAPTLIGRLSVILWIYFNAFKCVHRGGNFNIPKEIGADCVRYAEQIIKTSYSHHENFCTSVFHGSSGSATHVSKPRKTAAHKVLSAVIRSEGCFAVMQKICKNVRPLTAKIVKGELQDLEDEGFGKLVTREDMLGDKERGFSDALTVFFKPAPSTVDPEIFHRLRDPDLNSNFYLAQFRKANAEKMFKMIKRYHPNVEDLTSSQCGPFDDSQDNNPLNYEHLDGVVKSKIFMTKKQEKVKVNVSTTASNPPKTKFAEKMTEERKEPSQKYDSPKGKKQSKGKPSSDIPSTSKATFTIMATSEELYSTENSDTTYSGVTERKKKCENVVKSKKSTTDITMSKEFKSDDVGGFSTQDFRDFANDSSFHDNSQERFSNKPINSPPISTAVNVTITKEEEESTEILYNTTKGQGPSKDVVSDDSDGIEDKKVKSKGKYQAHKGNASKVKKGSNDNSIKVSHEKGNDNSNFVPETCPNTPPHDEFASAKRKSELVISESSPGNSSGRSDRSDSSVEKQIKKKRRRRLSLSKRNQQEALRRSARLQDADKKQCNN